MTTLEENRWNSMDAPSRHDWLIAAGEHNVALQFLDWQELPEPLAIKLMEVYKD